jgi:hypothetical protein
MRYDYFILFLLKFSLVVPIEPPIPVVLVHQIHQGAHAIAQSLSISFPCVFNFGEWLDVPGFGRYNEIERGHALSSFYNRNMSSMLTHVNLTKRMHLADGFDDIRSDPLGRLEMCNKMRIQSIIVIMLRHEKLLQHFMTKYVKVLFLVRKDIMRHSLSICRCNGYGKANYHPQFIYGHVSDINLYNRKPAHFPLDAVINASKRASKYWNDTVECIPKVLDVIPFKNVLIVTYEDFLEKSDFSSTLCQRIRGDKCGFKEKIIDSYLKSNFSLKMVSKVHPNNISIFVKNSQNIQDYFDKQAKTDPFSFKITFENYLSRVNPLWRNKSSKIFLFPYR